MARSLCFLLLLLLPNRGKANRIQRKSHQTRFAEVWNKNKKFLCGWSGEIKRQVSPGQFQRYFGSSFPGCHHPKITMASTMGANSSAPKNASWVLAYPPTPSAVSASLKMVLRYTNKLLTTRAALNCLSPLELVLVAALRAFDRNTNSRMRKSKNVKTW